MARIRTIKPTFFTNEQLADLDPLTRLLFIGLWTMADRDGRLEDRPRKIKAELLPFDNVDVDKALNDLKSAGLISRYVVGELKCIAVINFEKHQRPHPKEPASTLPAAKKHGKTRKETAGCALMDKGKESREGTSQAMEDPALHASFNAFEKAYPKKTKRAAAWQAWVKLRPSGELVDTILAAIESQKRSEQWQRKIIPHAANWLNERRWEDELPEGTGPPARRRMDEVSERFLQGEVATA